MLSAVRQSHRRVFNSIAASLHRVRNRNSYIGQRYRGASSTSTSISQDEVSKFSGMDKDWWDPSFHPLIAMNPIRIRYILDIVQKQHSATTNHNNPNAPPLHNFKALDVGCGGGLLSESLARLGANVTAIDPSEALVQKAQEHAMQTGDPRLRNIDYRGGLSVEELAATEDDNHPLLFDVVCLLEVLEHASDVASLVQAASSLVKPDTGLLFVSTMNRTWKSHLLTIVGAEYIMGYVPRGTHDWNQYLAPQEVAQTMDGFGMEQVHVSGMVLTKPPLCGQWDWKLDGNDTDVNWIGAYRRRINPT
ncbi:biosynthesis O-methyltransferase [Seminavis robusta]|uniref:Ubiquinone biosynthesis O-methyltransferase, mitochondrial n=1 Tax=Seminavis robusta TaxID=568900 RepID=A0A9N8E6T1_9STRA|nr:biosynthesis O-methyltransferase [Seminavis robusta]|eukprot:Sro610_g175130.1 biosynthesis O-methyltransferase (305) ;mRNA; f:23522-24436